MLLRFSTREVWLAPGAGDVVIYAGLGNSNELGEAGVSTMRKTREDEQAAKSCIKLMQILETPGIAGFCVLEHESLLPSPVTPFIRRRAKLTTVR